MSRIFSAGPVPRPSTRRRARAQSPAAQPPRGTYNRRVPNTPSPLPPGNTESLHSERALVLAPHYDDEVVGCGGLIVQLSQAGARVTVAFLTDSSGGAESVPLGWSPEDYRRTRRAEAEKVAERLGVSKLLHFDLQDGELSSSVAELAAHYRETLLEIEPDLLLVPSPLEVTSDHRAAFASLHDLLAELRGGTPLDRVAEGLEILCYEVNHPAYPDLLVDVSDHIVDIEEAMTLYASQQERHDYRAAAVGLRRYRTHSLPSSIEAAEAYRRLRVSDFSTRSLSALVSHLGGAPSRLEVRSAVEISIVVRTKDRPELLAEALDSLADTGYPKLEVVLVNDGGAPPEPRGELPFGIERVDLPDSRGRAAAANAGIARSTGSWLGFLDDDDIVFPEHLAVLGEVAKAAGTRVVYSDAAVGVYRMSGGDLPGGRTTSNARGGWINTERRLPYSRDFDPAILLLDNYIPFNTLLMERAAVLEAGPLDEELVFFEDWDFLIRLAKVGPFHHLSRVTCEYRHFVGAGHHILGGRSEDRAFGEMKARIIERHWGELTPARLAGAVSRLRRDVVAIGDSQQTHLEAHRAQLDARLRLEARLRNDIDELDSQLAAQSSERERLAQRSFDLEAQLEELNRRYHQLNGELVNLRADKERWLSEQATKAVEREQLRVALDDRGHHLDRTHAEIERLNALVDEMRGTRAWRLHQRWQRLLGRGAHRSE